MVQNRAAGYERRMGFVISLLLIAVGAILTWAVKDTSSSINLDVVGIILMIVGGISFLLTMWFWESWWGPGYFRRTAYRDEGPAYGYRRPLRRGGYVEEEIEEGPPAAGPPY
jgi:hypothetical protein